MKFLVCFLIAIFSPLHVHSQEQIYIKVGEAAVKKSLIALPPMVFLSSPALAPKYKQVGQDLFNTLYNDVDASSYFQVIDPKAFLEDVATVGLRPKPGDPNGFSFEKWSQIGTEFLVRVGYKIAGSDITLDAYVYYVPQAKAILTRSYSGQISEVRYIAHTLADDMIEALTGKKGWFRSKIVFVSDRDRLNPIDRWKEVYVSDWDGHNMKRITNHKSIAISPSWSPDGKTILYSAHTYHRDQKVHNVDLYSYELYTGKRFLLSWFKGLNMGGTFDPSGKFIYLSISKEETTDIFRMTLEGKDQKNLTKGPLRAMNVEAAVSPDGTQIAFSSTRSGSPMIFLMNIDGTNIRRRTTAGKYNATPAWSPDGKKIAFAGQDGNHFDLFIMNSDGTNLQRLTDARKSNGRAASNEAPTFSPDGRQIIFISDRNGTKQLFMVNADGTRERPITTDNHNYNSPKWLWKLP